MEDDAMHWTRLRSRIGLTAALTVTTALVTGTGGATLAQDDAPVTLRLAVADDGAARPSYSVVQAFAQAASQLSGGAITVEPTFDAAGSTFEVGTAKLLLGGAFDLAVVAGRSWDQVGVDSFRALQAPFLIDDDALAEAVADSDTARVLLDSLDAYGLIGLELWPEDLRHPAAYPGCTAPLVTPDGFAGVDVRVPAPSGVTYDLLEALGAHPSTGEWDGECTLQATESGLRQGASLPSATTFTGDVTFYPKFQVLAANAAVFERLSDAQQQVIRDAAAAAQDVAIETHPSEAQAAEEWCAQGGQVVLAGPGGITAFQAAAQPVLDQLAQDPVAAEALAAISALKETVEPAPGAIACGAEAVPEGPIEAATGPTPIDGTYVTHVSFEDLSSSPLLYDQGEVNDGNWGDLTFVFDSGTFSYTQANPRQSFAYETTGPYNVDGDVLTFYDPSACCPPQPFSYHWSLDGDTLTLERIQELTGPTTYIVKPWTRLPDESDSAGVPTLIDGTYITHVSFDELASSPLLYGEWEASDENWGDMSFRFDAGTFTHTLENPTGQWVESGSYALDGDTLTLAFESRYPQEVFTYRWSLEGDTLTLERIPALEGPTPFIVKPWTRLPDEAAREQAVVDPSGVPADGSWRIEITREAMESAGVSEDIIYNVAGLYTWSFQGAGDGSTGTFELGVQSPAWSSFSCGGEFIAQEDSNLLIRYLTGRNCGRRETLWHWSVDEDGNGHVEVLDTPPVDVSIDREMWKSAPFIQIDG
jgi:TRAP-type C4-dicarboxylate transport system substrate-binding protein